MVDDSMLTQAESLGLGRPLELGCPKCRDKDARIAELERLCAVRSLSAVGMNDMTDAEVAHYLEIGTISETFHFMLRSAFDVRVAQLADARAEVAALKANNSAHADLTLQVQNLLALIFRDGGQYAAQHGLEKACRDAEVVLPTWRTHDVVAAMRNDAGKCVSCGAEICQRCGECKTCHNEDPVSDCPGTSGNPHPPEREAR